MMKKTFILLLTLTIGILTALPVTNTTIEDFTPPIGFEITPLDDLPPMRNQ